MCSSEGPALYSNWINQSPCKCPGWGDMRATEIKWRLHTMRSGFGEVASETGRWLAGICTLGLSTVINGLLYLLYFNFQLCQAKIASRMGDIVIFISK